MTWFKLDDGFWRHRKVRRLRGDRLAGVGLWMLAGNWAADNLTDGFVPDEVLATWGTPSVTAFGTGGDVAHLTERLVEVGLWHRDEVDGEPGVRFHQWAEHQPTRDEVLSRRKADAERKARSRAARRSEQASRRDTRPDTTADVRRDDDREGSDVTPDVTADVRAESHRESASPDPTRPDPTRPGFPSGNPASSPGGDDAARARREGPAAVRSDRDRRRRRDASVVELAKNARSALADSLVNDWARTCKLYPGARLRTALAVEVDTLLASGWPTDVLADCIEAWHGKGLGPAAFQAVANEVGNRRAAARPAQVATTDRKFAEAQALKERLRAGPGFPDARASAGGSR